MILQKYLFLFLFCPLVWISCQHDDRAYLDPELIILDTDMGSDCDDVGAMALLHQYAAEGKAEILGVIYITIGHTRGLYELLISPPDSISELNRKELVGQKVKRWIALGALGAGNENGSFTKDWNFFFNETATYTKYLVDHFPGPVYFVDGGSSVFTGKSLAGTPGGNIVRTAYSDWLWNVEKKTLEDQRPSWDLVTVFYAIEGTDRYFKELDPGYLEFDPEKGCRWKVSDTLTSHHFIRQKEDSNQELSDYLNLMISKY